MRTMSLYQTYLYQQYQKAGDTVRKFAGKIILRIVPNISPNQITLSSFVTGIIAAWLVAKGYWILGAVVYYISDVLDGIDGYVARETNKNSAYGAYLDSTLDRYIDVLMRSAVVYSYVNQQVLPSYWIIILGIAILGVLLPSYTTHRAESLEKVALQFPIPFGRRIRMHLLVLGLVLGKPEYIIILFGIIGNMNIVWRLRPQTLTTYARLSKPEKESLPKTTIRKYTK